MTYWWTPFANVALGVILGFAAAEVRERITRKRTRRGHFEALAAEIRICGATAAGYLKGSVKSPAYRMPLIGHERSLPAVLVEGVLNQNQSDALIRFYNNARAFNLCLDYCHDALLDQRRKDDPDRLDQEVRRARLKATKLAPGTGTQYDDAIAVVKKNLPHESLQQLAFDPDEE